ncbi:hypothetical protein CAPTEDRAFT_169300 [Capitella teleta]|uniref:Calcyclin-binding protein n=1 Tax=Capitella teleta TaxID=283909 RepID=R7TN36_CAPTE|nr:hypothetical protein CAPTEDRAFT_169300 [Capitella teleta]|eukprot:ELT92966.1 hypothetical protein CAPTEDRAFT_169300 [Capitella teleta]
MATIVELQADVSELQKLSEEATRKKVKDILFIEIRKLQTEITKLKEAEEKPESKAAAPKAPVAASSHVYTVTLTNYAWDQSDKFMKIYVTLNGVQDIDPSNICCEFKSRSFKLQVSNLDKKRHVLHVANLFEDVDTEKSVCKVKKDMVLLMLKKAEEKKTWAYVTQKDGAKKASAKKKLDESANPQDGLMSMLQDMYTEGDDEMKRTIAQAWSKSRDPSGPGGMAGMDM